MGMGIGKWDLTFPQDLLPLLDMHKIHSHSLTNTQNNLVHIPIKQKFYWKKNQEEKKKEKSFHPSLMPLPLYSLTSPIIDQHPSLNPLLH